MSEKIDGYATLKIEFKEKYDQIVGKERQFPKYTTQLINIASQNAQGTRPSVVGQM